MNYVRGKLQVNFDLGQDWSEDKGKVVPADRVTLHPGARIRLV